MEGIRVPETLNCGSLGGLEHAPSENLGALKCILKPTELIFMLHVKKFD